MSPIVPTKHSTWVFILSIIAFVLGGVCWWAVYPATQHDAAFWVGVVLMAPLIYLTFTTIGKVGRGSKWLQHRSKLVRFLFALGWLLRFNCFIWTADVAAVATIR